MRSKAIEHAGSFLQRLADEAELAMFQVAQPSVDQLARTTRCSGSQVARLNERDPQSACRSIESSTTANDAAADDRDIKLLIRHPRQRATALLGVKGSILRDHS